MNYFQWLCRDFSESLRWFLIGCILLISGILLNSKQNFLSFTEFSESNRIFWILQNLLTLIFLNIQNFVKYVLNLLLIHRKKMWTRASKKNSNATSCKFPFEKFSQSRFKVNQDQRFIFMSLSNIHFNFILFLKAEMLRFVRKYWI